MKQGQSVGGVLVLVLGRRPGEYIVIDERIIVKVVRSNNGNLRLAIDAPSDVPIVRGEVYETNQRLEKDNLDKVNRAL